ncbi:DUF3483 domain-containing protein [Brevibacillus fluminis]|uniref:DUF3483 domain-containing protein n=1 Tax=Brevibacillus fluminis TaxID=511487 RepID=A0A3M8DPU0_9BACL|nr:4Fe-4S dicluster domain-containing protein [Brevibacillus fluminis]RNB89455.1 DUF3483 domain-containing protein [Brevibacillus fluminis]
MIEIRRDTFWAIPFAYSLLMYVLATIALLVFLYGFYRRFRLWRSGRKVNIQWADVKANASYFVDMAIKQQKIKRDRLYGFMHRFTSYGFVILFIGTCLVVVDYDLGIPILQGSFYLVYEAVLDVFGVLFLIGLFIAMIVRARRTRNRLKHGWADQLFLWLFAAIGIGGYLLEGIRIAETGISYGHWSIVGYGVSKLLQGVPAFGVAWYPVWWISHAILAFGLIAVIPYTKLFHMLLAPINLLFQPVKRTGKISLPYNLEELTEEKRFTVAGVQGVKHISDFTSWQLLSTDACTECGRCDSLCPANLSGKPLAPRSIVTKIRDYMVPDRKITSFITPEELQSCTTCGACVEACPVSINHIDLILSMRRGLIQERIIEQEAEHALMKLDEQYNVWGKAWSERDQWSRGLDIPLLENDKGNDDKKGA